jgi:hypothetical protein
LGQQHQDHVPGRQCQVGDAGHDDGDAQQPVTQQPAHPFGDLAPQAGARRVGGPLGSEAARDGSDQRRAEQERGRVDQERHGAGQGEQQSAQRWADELLADLLGAEQLPVGALQPTGVAADQRGDDRLGGAVEQRLADAEQEPGGHQQRDAGPAGQHGDAEPADDAKAGGVHGPHHLPAVPAIHKGAADRAEQQPGQPTGGADDSHLEGVAGERRSQERQRGEEHPVAEVGDGRCGPQLAVVGAERGSGVPAAQGGHGSCSGPRCRAVNAPTTVGRGWYG